MAEAKLFLALVVFALCYAVGTLALLSLYWRIDRRLRRIEARLSHGGLKQDTERLEDEHDSR